MARIGWQACGLLLVGLAWGAGAQDDFSAFEEMEKKAFAAFEEQDRGVRLEWERREAEAARTWMEERRALLARFGIVEAEAKADPLKTVETAAVRDDAVSQAQIDFGGGTVKVEAVVVAATEEEARQRAEELARDRLQETVGKVPAAAGKTLAEQGGTQARQERVERVHDETRKTSARLPDGKVEARVSLEQPLTGEKGLVALALENAAPGEAADATQEIPAKAAVAEPAAEQAAEDMAATADAAPANAPPPAVGKADGGAQAAAGDAVAESPTSLPAAAGPFTGLLLDASGAPGARPALVPTVRGEDGTLVYGPATVKKEQAIHGMAEWLRDEGAAGGSAKLGKNPLRVAVKAVRRGGALTVGDADAARIRATDTGFLADCKVAVLLGK